MSHDRDPFVSGAMNIVTISKPYIYKVGEHVIEGIIQHQQHKPQPEGTYNPDKLLAGTRREVQKVTVTIIITRPTDTEPAEYNQQQVNDNRHPVQ